jgi:acyl-CoA thioesterase FadM
MQEGTSDLFEAAGIDMSKLALGHQTMMAIHMSCDFMKPVGYREVIEVRPFVKEVGESSLQIQYDLQRGDELLAVGKTVHVHFDTRTKKKAPIPDDLRKKLVSVTSNAP